MTRRLCFLCFCALSVAALASGPQVTIPATRVRIVYKDTGQPVEWVVIDVTCLRTDLTRAERKELFEREKREYDALIAQGKQIPYQDFSDWRSVKSGVRSLLLACWVTNTEDLTPCDMLVIMAIVTTLATTPFPEPVAIEEAA